MLFKLYEIFKSIQGEGVLQGVPSVLVRLTKCNLNCKWCDTKGFLENNKYFTLSEEELFQQLEGYECKNIIITGGEPMLEKNLNELVESLRTKGYHVTIETNGTLFRNIKCDLISLSPKLSNSVNDDSKSKNRINIEAIKNYIKNNDYQIKFVADDNEKDFMEIKSILDELDYYDPFKVMIMPLAGTVEELLKKQKNIVQLCVKYGFRYANRLQLQIWGNNAEIL